MRVWADFGGREDKFTLLCIPHMQHTDAYIYTHHTHALIKMNADT